MGLVIACLVLLPFYQKKISNLEIENKARAMGMVYPDEIKAIDKGGNNND